MKLAGGTLIEHFCSNRLVGGWVAGWNTLDCNVTKGTLVQILAGHWKKLIKN